MSDPPLVRRRDELGLDDALINEWRDEVAADVVDALLASLIRFDDALRELSR